jgi:hypothetical protein
MARQKTRKRASKKSKSRKNRPFFAYPLYIFLLLCAGVFLIAWTLRAGADDILVTAKVAAVPVTSPAVITNPASGQHFSSIPINVSGTCPPNAAYVEIFRNSVMGGTAICSAGGTFDLSVDLFPGLNSLTAHVFNSTDDEGPVSSPVTVYYDAPQPPQPPGGSPRAGSPSSNPLILKTSFIFKGYHAGDQVDWPIDISGGAAPYAVSIDWGDGNTDLVSRPLSGTFNISHTYSQAGGYKDSYTIKVKATDAAGNSGFIQFFVIVTPQSIQQAGNLFNKPTPKIGGGLNLLWIAWPLYSLVLLMVVSYKLGEREELVVLRRRGSLRR